jgi:hypothetical protein
VPHTLPGAEWNVEIYFDFRKHRYYRRHTFDHYMLFSVDADEKRQEPAKPATVNSREGKKSPHENVNFPQQSCQIPKEAGCIILHLIPPKEQS